MMKESLKYYFTSIAITLLVLIFAICFVMIAGHAKSLTGDRALEILQMDTVEDGAYRITVLGESYFTVTPAPIRLVEQGIAALQNKTAYFFEQRKRQEFEQNILQDEMQDEARE